MKARDRFPHATVQFIEKIGTANWQRLKRIQKMNMEDEGPAEVKILQADRLKSAFYDSAIGSSIQLASRGVDSQQVRSVASFRSFMEHEDGAARAPSIPQEASKGEPFRCFICEQIIKDVSSDSEWK